MRLLSRAEESFDCSKEESVVDMNLLLFLILLHLLTDFVFQSDAFVVKKLNYYSRSSKLFVTKNPLWTHGIYAFLLMQFMYFFFSPWYQILLLSLLITLAHVILDHYKLLQNKKTHNKMALFLLDQSIHVVVIYIVNSIFTIHESEKYLPLFGHYKTNLNKGEWTIPHIPNNLLLCLIFIITFSMVAGILISFMLENIKASKKSDINATRALSDSEKKIGLKIGLIERLLVIIFVSAGQFGALGLILAGKSLARYEDLKDKAFAEYYLLGTLLSFLFGVIGGLLVKLVF